MGGEQFVSWSNNQIVFVLPGGATTGNLSVTVYGHLTNPIPFTVLPEPLLTGISPDAGPVGTTVTISGANLADFENKGTVTLHGQSLPILSQSATALQVNIPSGATTGVLDVVVNGVTLTTPTFTVTSTPAAPHVTSLSANYAALYANITLTGTGFGASQGLSAVTFNGVTAPVLAWSNTSITVTVPYRATTGNVSVTAGGQASNSVPFTIEATPTVSGISPTSGPVGTLVTISGQNLLDARIVAQWICLTPSFPS